MRDFSLASLELLCGTLMLAFGTIFGGVAWYRSVSDGTIATTGTVMIAVLPIILGFQLILSFLGFDIANEPRQTLHYDLSASAQRRSAAKLRRAS